MSVRRRTLKNATWRDLIVLEAECHAAAAAARADLAQADLDRNLVISEIIRRIDNHNGDPT